MEWKSLHLLPELLLSSFSYTFKHIHKYLVRQTELGMGLLLSGGGWHERPSYIDSMSCPTEKLTIINVPLAHHKGFTM